MYFDQFCYKVIQNQVSDNLPYFALKWTALLKRQITNAIKAQDHLLTTKALHISFFREMAY